MAPLLDTVWAAIQQSAAEYGGSLSAAEAPELFIDRLPERRTKWQSEGPLSPAWSNAAGAGKGWFVRVYVTVGERFF